MNADLTSRLDEGLVARGYVLVQSHDDPVAFGSWYRDYTRGVQRIRLIWDARDRWFVLQGGEAWHDLAVKRPAELVGCAVDDFLAHADW